MDFKLFLKNKHGYDIAFIVVNWLSKQAVSLPYFKTITAKDIACMYVNNIYRIYGALKLIVSNYGP